MICACGHDDAIDHGPMGCRVCGCPGFVLPPLSDAARAVLVEVGRRGGLENLRRHGKAGMSRAGKAGGAAVAAKRTRDDWAALGRKGAAARLARKAALDAAKRGGA